MPDSAPKPAKVTPPKEAKPAASKPAAKPKDTPPPANRPKGRPPELQKQLEEMIMMAGLMTAGAINEFDGEVIRDNAAALAEAWYKVSQTNATVKRILQSMTETGAWSGAVMSTAAIAIPIMQNHGAIPDSVPHPFKKPPRLQPPAPNVPDPRGPFAPPMQPPPQGSVITPSNAQTPPEPPPGQHIYGPGNQQ
jgi:hypothetical protein